jgi:NAD(P)H-hydrate epimerase
MAGPLNLFDAAALRRVEAQASAALGGDDFELMRRAGQAAWRHLLQHWPEAQRILVLCGPGNNGGDGYVVARHALEAGRAVAVVRYGHVTPRSAAASRASGEFIAAGGGFADLDDVLASADVVVDALFGIGLSRAPEDEPGALIDAVNASGVPVFALDVPSGVDADTGHLPGVAIRAERTLQFIAAHPGLQTGRALDVRGRTDLASLDVPEAAWQDVGVPLAELLQVDALAGLLPPRRRDSHKGDHGHVLCVGGDAGMGGAVLLCAEAALRAGAGLVSVATRAAHVPALLARRPECMAVGIDAPTQLAPLLMRADVVALGPGLGHDNWGQALLDAVLDSGRPLVVDADALNLLAQSPRELPGAVLTPHPGEAARLLGTSTGAVQADRYDAACRVAARFACAVVLKGAGSIVAMPGRLPQVIAAGNPGMAVGGMGDVLTGAVAAVRAQGLDAFDAACAGALLHAHAGDLAARDGERGLLPSDLLACLRLAANPSSPT